jgi:hypothetical protein
MVIYYCDSCGERIPNAAMESHAAVVVGENKALCAKCAAATRRPTGQTALPDKTQSRSTIRLPARASTERQAASTAVAAFPVQTTQAPQISRNLKIAIFAGSGGALLFLFGVMMLLSGGGGEEASTKVAAAPEAKQPVQAAAQPPIPAKGIEAAAKRVTPAQDPKRQPGGADTQDKGQPAGAVRGAGAVGDPPAAAGVRAEKSTPQPIVVPTAPNEVIWIEDDLPPGATPDGTTDHKPAAWVWVTQPDPVFSGLRAHTQGGIDHPVGATRQHFFEKADPIPVGPDDVFFTYVNIDPKNPPRAIMLQWRANNNWEHRAYWGENVIQHGQDQSPSRLTKGALPKAGEWVRLEVQASEVGINGTEQLMGWAFTQAGGTVYWDRAGLVRATHTAVAEKKPDAPQKPPEAPVPPPSEGLLGTGAKPVASFIPSALAKIAGKDLKGGQYYNSFSNNDKRESKAIWAQTTNVKELNGSFELAWGRYADGELAVVTHLHNGQPCLISIAINGQEIFNGRDKATEHWKWTQQLYAIPQGVLRGGKNEIVFKNLEPSGRIHAEPWYMLHALEIRGALQADFPPIVTDALRGALQTYATVFETLAKKDLAPAARVDQALRAAKAGADDDVQPLVNALERAAAMQKLAAENLAKKPPTEPVTVEKLKLTGTIAKIDGGRAYIRSQGIEMPVDVALLPQALFAKALALDETKPQGQADKAAYLLSLGDVDAAAQMLKRMKKGDAPAWAAAFERRTALEKALKFEEMVKAVESFVKTGKTAEAVSALNELRKDYAELVAAHKERMEYLTKRTEK